MHAMECAWQLLDGGHLNMPYAAKTDVGSHRVQSRHWVRGRANVGLAKVLPNRPQQISGAALVSMGIAMAPFHTRAYGSSL